MVRTNVYVDGFNLYHGLRDLASGQSESPSWKWLDLMALSQRLVPADEVNLIRYFTARLNSFGNSPERLQRQQTYIRALQSRPRLEVHLGKFSAQQRWMPLVQPPGPKSRRLARLLGIRIRTHRDGNATIKVWRLEERGSDVNLAAHLLMDAMRGDFDKAVVISNDTDLCEPIRIVATDFGLPVVVVNPRGHRHQAKELQRIATDKRNLRLQAVIASQLPSPLFDEFGRVAKPDSW